MSKLAVLAYIGLALFSVISTVLLYGAVAYVVGHFIRKLW